MFSKIRDIFASKALRERVLFTLGMIAIYRVGSFIPCPFISVEYMEDAFGGGGLGGGLFGVADMFTGGAFSNLTLFSLGIMPYISASIIFQMLALVIPQLEKIRKEGESGQRKITQWTRYATVALAAIQGLGLGAYVLSLEQSEGTRVIASTMANNQTLFLFLMALSVTAGTTFLMWLGEKITEHGVGNGISLLIALGIMAGYPAAVRTSFRAVELESIAPIWLLIVGALCIGATILIVLIQEGARKIPIQHAKQMVGRKMSASQTNYLPLKVNTAGVMPVIFSSAILTLPATIFGWVGATPTGAGFLGELFAMTSSYNLYNAFGVEKESIFLLLRAMNLYTFLFVVLTAFFCFFYTSVVFNPQDVADNLRRMGAFVPGYRPGKQTAEYIDRVMSRITLVGAVFLCSVAVFPQLLFVSFDIPYQLADFAGGTGLIIVVAVVLDTMKQVESRMMMSHYEGFKSRRRSGGARRWAKQQQ